MKYLPLFLSLFLACVAGCAINPVTGERELGFIGEQQEIAIGKEQYEPGRQMEGGDYLLDQQLTAYVDEIGQKLARVSDRPLPYEFKVLNNSVPNAWALPGGKISINRGLLLELNNEAELAAVLSHEIVHSAARHGAQRMEKGMLMQGALLATAVAVADSSYSGIAVGGAQLAANVITQKYSREAELEADYYGMHYMSRAGYDPQSAVSLQQTFVRLSGEKKSNWLNGLFASHPPSQERVEANRRTAQSLKPGGEIGEKRYREKIKYIHENAPAYKAYDNGVLALKKGDITKALALASEAMQIEPREALFLGLQGEAYFQQGDYGKALASSNRALDLNNRFFQFYLQRGLIREKMGDLAGARQDLEHSTKLLPNANAFKKLGDMSLVSGSTADAKAFFQKAASSQSLAGKDAAISFLRLDLPENPSKYLRLTLEQAKDGTARLRLSNPTPLPVHHIKCVARFLDARGTTQQIDLAHPGPVRPGKSVIIPLDGQKIAAKQQHTLQAKIVAAQIAQ